MPRQSKAKRAEDSRYQERELITLEQWLRDENGKPYLYKTIRREKRQALFIVKNDHTFIIKETPKEERLVKPGTPPRPEPIREPEPPKVEAKPEGLDSQANRQIPLAETLMYIEDVQTLEGLKQYEKDSRPKVKAAVKQRKQELSKK